MPTISKTLVITAIGVAIGTVAAKKFVQPSLRNALHKVA